MKKKKEQTKKPKALQHKKHRHKLGKEKRGRTERGESKNKNIELGRKKDGTITHIHTLRENV